MRDGRGIAATASRDNRRQVSLCDFANPKHRCWGRGYNHKKLGGKRDGRDYGKLVALVFTCEGHFEAGRTDVPQLYDQGSDSLDEFWDDGYVFAYGGYELTPRSDDRPRGKSWTCQSCAATTVYYGKYDSFACIKCDKFVEPNHCVGRECDSGFESQPAKPSLSKYRYETYEQVFGGG